MTPRAISFARIDDAFGAEGGVSELPKIRRRRGATIKLRKAATEVSPASALVCPAPQNEKPRTGGACCFWGVAKLAEREGFEPPLRCRKPDFESGAFDHSATSPDRRAEL